MTSLLVGVLAIVVLGYLFDIPARLERWTVDGKIDELIAANRPKAPKFTGFKPDIRDRRMGERRLAEEVRQTSARIDSGGSPIAEVMRRQA